MKGIEIQRLGCRALQTTIIACECSGGVVLGADSRTSMGVLPMHCWYSVISLTMQGALDS